MTMSTCTVLLEVVPADGAAAWRNAWEGPGFRAFQSTPPDTFGEWLDGDVPVTIRHGGPVVGHLDYAEHGLGHGDGAMFAVATLEGVAAKDVDGRVMASAEIRANGLARTIPTTEVRNGRFRSSSRTVGDMYATESKLAGVALVDESASITSTRVRAWAGDYRDPVARGRWNVRTVPAILDRAVAAVPPSVRHRRPEAVRICQPARHGDRRYVEVGEYRNSGERPEVVRHGGGYVLGLRTAEAS